MQNINQKKDTAWDTVNFSGTYFIEVILLDPPLFTKLIHFYLNVHMSSRHPKEITVTVVIQIIVLTNTVFLVCESNHCADAKSFFFHCSTILQHS